MEVTFRALRGHGEPGENSSQYALADSFPEKLAPEFKRYQRAVVGEGKGKSEDTKGLIADYIDLDLMYS